MAKAKYVRPYGIATIKDADFLRLEGVKGKMFKVTYRYGAREDEFVVAITNNLKPGIYQYGKRSKIPVYALSGDLWNLSPEVSPSGGKELPGILLKGAKSVINRIKYANKYIRDKNFKFFSPHSEALYNSGEKILEEFEKMVYANPIENG